MDNEQTSMIEMNLDEMRACVKSLGIGIDQLMRKTERVSGSRKEEILNEIVLLSNAKFAIEEAMIEQIRN